jgi:uncharacterized protein with beta-barrel porin domain
MTRTLPLDRIRDQRSPLARRLLGGSAVIALLALGVAAPLGVALARHPEAQTTLTNPGPISLGNYDGASSFYIGPTTTITATGTAILGGASKAYTLVNTGTISGTGDSGTGVNLQDGGTITNQGTLATIYGGNVGVSIVGPGTVTNAGTITAHNDTAVQLNNGGLVTNEGTLATIHGGDFGVYVRGGTGTVINYGTITGPGNTGVQLASGGKVSNDGSRATIYGGFNGIFISGAAGTVTNSGTVISPTIGSAINGSVELTQGGIVKNQGSLATISGGHVGVYIYGGAGTVTNSGTIAGTGTAGIGVVFSDSHGTYNNTLINSGTIIGIGNSRTAVQFGNGTNLLELQPGAAFTGIVAGGTGTNTLELAAGTVAGTGTLSGLGTSFTHFGVVNVDSGAAWTFTGANNIASGVTLTNNGTLSNSGTITNGGTFVDAGKLANSGTIVGGAALSGASVLTNSGVITTAAGAGVTVTGGTALITNMGTIAATGTAGVGVLFTGGSGTIDNFGTIIGAGGTAVQFAGGTNELIIESGSALVGVANGGSGNNTLLVAGTGTLSNAQIVGFQTVEFQNASNSIGSGSTVTNPSVVSGTLNNQGTLTGAVTVASGTGLANNAVINVTAASTNSGTFVNSGTITNTSTLTNTGSFTNTALVLGTTTGLTGGGDITNSGTIMGTSGTGVQLTSAGTLTNMAGGLIQGGQYGVQVGSGGTVANAGTILDDLTAGASLGSNSVLSNATTGTISGVTGVIFTGTGASLTNNGTITGTGGTAIQFDAGVNNLTLGTGSVLTGAIDGGGGAGQITLAGTNSLTNTIQNFGAGSALAVSSGADWTATGSWTIANVTNAGTLQAGDLVNPLKLTGNFTQNSGGTLRVALNASGAGSQFQITGSAALAGSLAIVPSGTFLAPSTPYTILTASGGVTGGFGGGVTIGSALLTPTVAVDPNEVVVTLAQKAVASSPSPSVAALFETPNEHAAAVAFDAGLAQNPAGFAAAIRGLDQLPASGVEAALDRLSGELHASLTTTALQNGAQFTAQFDQQTMLARRGASGTQSGADAMAAGGRQQLASLSGSSDDPVANLERPWGVWSSGYGQSSQYSGDGNAHRLTATLGGGAVGADYLVTPSVRLGAALGYGGTSFSLDNGGGHAQIDHTQFAYYGEYVQGPAYLDGSFGLAYGDGRTQRNVSLPGAPAEASGHTTDIGLLGSVEAGYGLALGPTTMTPFARFAFATDDQNGFGETGGGALDLNVAKQSASSAKSTLGGRFDADLPIGTALVGTDVTFGWAHEFAPTGRTSLAAFSGAPGDSFVVSGAKAPENSAIVGVGLATGLFANTSVYVRYDGELSSADTSHAVTAGFRVSW